jgi:hypothetical protein
MQQLVVGKMAHRTSAGNTALPLHRPASPKSESKKMLYTLAVVLVILWLLGMVTSVAAGGLIHILLVVAIVVVLVRIISGRRVI